jgi:type I restriction enzyme, S subunit
LTVETTPAIDAALPAQPIDPPTLSVTFRINDGPLAGREGDKVQSRVIRERLLREAEGNVALRIEEALQRLSLEVAKLGDPHIAEVRAVTRFRKRAYVQQGGIPLLSTKELFQIDPVDQKALAKGAHTKDLPEIALRKHMVLVTCSGTIGRVQIMPG